MLTRACGALCRLATGVQYHAVWSWCGTKECDSFYVERGLGASVVEARPIVDGRLRADGQRLLLRSTLAQEWRLRSSSDFGAPPQLDLPRGMWAKRDVCLGYSAPEPIVQWGVTNRQFHNRRMMLLQAAPPALQDVAADGAEDGSAAGELLWPLRWPRHYADGHPEPFFVSDAKCAQPRMAADACCMHA